VDGTVRVPEQCFGGAISLQHKECPSGLFGACIEAGKGNGCGQNGVEGHRSRLIIGSELEALDNVGR
jgi:hypothetical protein